MPLPPESWDGVAEGVREREAQRDPLMRPPITAVSVVWRGAWYIGGIQVLEGGIALLTKSTLSQPAGFHERLIALTHRLRVTAEDGLDLDGRQHVVAWDPSALQARRMTPEQTRRAVDLMKRTQIIEVFP